MPNFCYNLSNNVNELLLLPELLPLSVLQPSLVSGRY